MINNKGFVVSAILYTILLAFLLFLGITLSIFSSSTATLGNATEDIVNSTELSINPVKAKTVPGAEKWYMSTNDILVKINSKYGIVYWPKEFGGTIGPREDGKIKSNGSISGLKGNKHGIYIYCAISPRNVLETKTKVTFEKENNPCNGDIPFSTLNSIGRTNDFYMYVSYDSPSAIYDKDGKFEIDITDKNKLIQIGY